MVALDERERLEAVGDEGVVAPVREQLGLSANQAGAADDEPAPAQAALGDGSARISVYLPGSSGGVVTIPA
jgi:hypothetical protein